MVFLFRDKSFVSVFFLIILCLLVHTHLLISTPNIATAEDSGIISFVITNYLIALPKGMMGLLYIAIILLQAIRLNILLNEYKMFQYSGFTTAMSYILLTGFFSQWATISPALIANTFVIWIFIQLSKLYNNPSPKSLLFNTGLIIGAAILCYQPTAMLIAVVFFALVIVRPFIISEWFVLLIGIIMPFYIISALLFLNDKINLLPTFLPRTKFGLIIPITDVWFWVSIAVIAVLLIAGFITLTNNNNRMVIQIRKNWNIMTVMVVMLIIIPFIFYNAGLQSAALSIIPLAAIIANIFLYPKKMLVPNLFFALAIIIIIHNNWVLIKN